jgi:prepilin-type N-terminal cleavage/methylation domain-containing protein
MKPKAHKSQAGFSLLEMLVSTAVMTIVIAAIFSQVNDAQRISTSEQVKLDLFQESRQFMDQMVRDLHASGYPSMRNFSSSGDVNGLAYPNNSNNAVGLVKLDANAGYLQFEASPDGSATVKEIIYNLDTSTDHGCPCLKRSELQKVAGDPLTGQTPPVYQTEVQNVVMTGDPIFYAYQHDGTPVTTAIDLLGNAVTIADINTLVIKLTVQSARADPRNGVKPIITLMSTVKLNNCSNSWTKTTTSAMGC